MGDRRGARLFFASLVTFGILVGMVIGLVLAAMVAAGEVNFTVASALTIVINLLIWLVSPWLSDLTLRWFNSLEFLDDATVRERYPAGAAWLGAWCLNRHRRQRHRRRDHAADRRQDGADAAPRLGR